jgi:hypothetical protein
MDKEEFDELLHLYLDEETRVTSFDGHAPPFSVNLVGGVVDLRVAEEFLRHDERFVALEKGVHTLYCRCEDEAYWREALEETDQEGGRKRMSGPVVLYAGIIREIALEGDASRFVMVSPGRFGPAKQE